MALTALDLVTLILLLILFLGLAWIALRVTRRYREQRIIETRVAQLANRMRCACGRHR